MDTKVTRIGAVVVAELRAAGYLESTIGQYVKTIRALAEYAAERGGAYSPGLGAEFASMTVSPRTGRLSAQRRLAYGRLVGVFDSYVRTGRVDLSVRGRGGGAVSRAGRVRGAGRRVGSGHGAPARTQIGHQPRQHHLQRIPGQVTSIVVRSRRAAGGAHRKRLPSRCPRQPRTRTA
jgi:hypothetical protein